MSNPTPIRDAIIAAAKTLVEAAVAALLQWAALRGWTLPTEITASIYALLLAAVTVAINMAATRWPVIGDVLGMPPATYRRLAD